MERVARKFPLNSLVNLPIDTEVLVPVVKKHRTGLRTHLSISTEEMQNSTKAYKRCNVVNMNQDISNKILVISTKKASYLAIDSDLRRPLELLLRGKTVHEALQSLEQMSPFNARERMRELLAHIEMRNFYEDASPEEYIPDGNNLHFYVTNKCNLHCGHCYLSSGSPLHDGEMSMRDRIRVLELFSEIYPRGKVTFTGGEPLMSPDIFDLLSKARRLGLEIKLFTNGLLINKSNVKRLVEATDSIQISLDGTTSRINDAIRGKGTFRKILHRIRLLDNASVANKHFSYQISLTLMPINTADICENLPSFLKRLNLKGKHRVVIGRASKLGRAAKNSNMFSRIELMSKNLDNVIKNLALRRAYSLPDFFNNRYSRTCGLGGTVAIGANGAIYPCSITEQPAIGNIRDRDAKKAMQNVKKYIEFSNVDNVEVCNQCSIRYFCKGICRLTNLRKTGSFCITKCSKEYKNEKILSLIRKYESFWISATGMSGPVFQ